jgi:hypothetical protein
VAPRGLAAGGNPEVPRGSPARIARGDASERPAFLLDYARTRPCSPQSRSSRPAAAGSPTRLTAALLIPAATGIAASLPRYVLAVYPAFFALAEFFHGRPRLRLAWWIGSALLLAAGEAAFVLWRFVA